MLRHYDYVIIGSGIMGMAIASVLKERNPKTTIAILDKEENVAFHASTRNSGVLHAGFYYTADSLKARLTVEGSRAWKKFCHKHDLPVNECGKLVVAQNEEELKGLYELEKRGKINGSSVEIIDESRVKKIDPNVKTYQKALYSPDTASIDPLRVCLQLKHNLLDQGVEFFFDTQYLSRHHQVVQTNQGEFYPKKLINCAGLYADRIAQDYGMGGRYTMMPFKGLYLKYTKNKTDITTNIYPVPNLKNPFLGVHFTKTVDGAIKIGPTAIPCFWREHYGGMDGFDCKEWLEIIGYQTKLFATNAFGFRNLAIEEMQKYFKSHFIALAQNMVENIDPQGFTEWTKPGIRAQLLNKKNLQLVQDFVVESDQNSVHVLNAVSPAFTCAIPFANYVVSTCIE